MPARRPAKAELAYTTRKIEANFSNFSAWHQRTKVLGALWASGELDRAKSQADGEPCVPFRLLGRKRGEADGAHGWCQSSSW